MYTYFEEWEFKMLVLFLPTFVPDRKILIGCNFAAPLKKLKNIIAGNILENSKCEKLLGIKTGSKVSFNSHVENLCNKLVTRCMHMLVTRTETFQKAVSFLTLFKTQIWLLSSSMYVLFWKNIIRNKHAS